MHFTTISTNQYCGAHKIKLTDHAQVFTSILGMHLDTLDCASSLDCATKEMTPYALR